MFLDKMVEEAKMTKLPANQSQITSTKVNDDSNANNNFHNKPSNETFFMRSISTPLQNNTVIQPQIKNNLDDLFGILDTLNDSNTVNDKDKKDTQIIDEYEIHNNNNWNMNVNILQFCLM